MSRSQAGRRWRAGAVAGLGAALTFTLAPVASAAPAAPDAAAAGPARLHLVTFDGSGTAGYRGGLTADAYRSVLTAQRDEALASVGAPAPDYAWTTALNGVAVQLTAEQADRLRTQDHVASVEENDVRTLAASPLASAPTRAATRQGGRGIVIGVVDTGIAPDSPLFADSPGLAPRSDQRRDDFLGRCQPGEDWSTRVCNDKLVAAGWFVTGFGQDRLASDESLSARDVRGHGTQIASIAAGNDEVSVDAPGLRGTFSGVAPQARVAAYKACWSTPDPVDDGCATADLVAAIDQATRDGVDVLNLSVTGGAGLDTVERALLGAAEAGIVVVAAAGNEGAAGYATHVSPWVTTVGGLASTTDGGSVGFGSRRVSGTMTAQRPVSGRLVAARSVPAASSSPAESAVCTPGSLDASAVAGRIVICERGALGRVEKSAAVQRADGVGVVLTDTGRGAPTHDLHAVPTLHLDVTAGATLTRWAARHPGRTVTLRPTGQTRQTPGVGRWSSGGDPTSSVLKPDLVAPGTGVLAGTAPTTLGSRWTLTSGTSAATAWTSGAAAVLLSHHDWSAPVVRSALATSAAPVGGVLRAGAGALRLERALATPLAYDVDPRAYRAWLRGDLRELNSPSLLVRGPSTSTRRLTNVGARAGRWQVTVTGFERHDVTVSPATLRLRPGQAADYTVTVGNGALGGLDDGAVVWTGADGEEIRIPVAISR